MAQCYARLRSPRRSEDLSGCAARVEPQASGRRARLEIAPLRAETTERTGERSADLERRGERDMGSRLYRLRARSASLRECDRRRESDHHDRCPCEGHAGDGEQVGDRRVAAEDDRADKACRDDCGGSPESMGGGGSDDPDELDMGTDASAERSHTARRRSPPGPVATRAVERQRGSTRRGISERPSGPRAGPPTTRLQPPSPGARGTRQRPSPRGPGCSGSPRRARSRAE